jgi:hypothetical protein
MNRSHGPGSSRSRHRRSSARQVDLSEEDDADISSHEFDPRTLVPSTQIGYMSSSSSSEADETFADVDVDADQAAQWISGNPFWFQEQEHVWHDDGLTTIMEGDEHGRPTPSPAAGSRLPSLMVTSPSTSGTSTLRPGSTAPF